MHMFDEVDMPQYSDTVSASELNLGIFHKSI